MGAVLIIIGMVIGVFAAVTVVMAYTAIETAREEEARERYAAKQRQKKLREDLNRPRDLEEQRIIDEAMKGIKRRDEG